MLLFLHFLHLWCQSVSKTIFLMLSWYKLQLLVLGIVLTTLYLVNLFTSCSCTMEPVYSGDCLRQPPLSYSQQCTSNDPSCSNFLINDKAVTFLQWPKILAKIPVPLMTTIDGFHCMQQVHGPLTHNPIDG